MSAEKVPSARPVATPTTAIIARRVKELRVNQELSGGKLAERLVERGLTSWTRTTVAKFETLHRQSVTVEELLGLAAALGVRATDLLPDPPRLSDQERLRQIAQELRDISTRASSQ